MQNERITTDTETYTKVYTPLDSRINDHTKEGYRVEVLPFKLANTEYVCVVSTLRPLDLNRQSVDIYYADSGIKLSSFDEMRGIFMSIARHQQEEK